MDVNFQYSKAPSAEPIVFEQVFGEKPGGGVVSNPAFDVPIGTALGFDSEGALQPIKCYKLVKAVEAADTTIEIAKGSGIAVGDIIATGKVAVESTALDSTDPTKDVVTVTLGVAVANGKKVYQAAEASADAAEPIYAPKYLNGQKVVAGGGDQLVKLVNGANVRKETVNTSDEVLAMMKNIEKV